MAPLQNIILSTKGIMKLQHTASSTDYSLTSIENAFALFPVAQCLFMHPGTSQERKLNKTLN